MCAASTVTWCSREVRDQSHAVGTDTCSRAALGVDVRGQVQVSARQGPAGMATASSSPRHGGIVTPTTRRGSFPVLLNWKMVFRTMLRQVPGCSEIVHPSPPLRHRHMAPAPEITNQSSCTRGCNTGRLTLPGESSNTAMPPSSTPRSRCTVEPSGAMACWASWRSRCSVDSVIATGCPFLQLLLSERGGGVAGPALDFNAVLQAGASHVEPRSLLLARIDSDAPRNGTGTARNSPAPSARRQRQQGPRHFGLGAQASRQFRPIAASRGTGQPPCGRQAFGQARTCHPHWLVGRLPGWGGWRRRCNSPSRLLTTDQLRMRFGPLAQRRRVSQWASTPPGGRSRW